MGLNSINRLAETRKEPPKVNIDISCDFGDWTLSSSTSVCFFHDHPNREDSNRMAPGQKMYPRGTVKKIIKAHSNCSISKNVDVLVSSSCSSTRLRRRALTLFPITDVPRLCRLPANVRQTIHPSATFDRNTGLQLDRLVKEAAIESKQGGERGITARSVRKVTGVGWR